jgi:hypothetical protein
MPIQVEPSSEFNLTTMRFAEDNDVDADTFVDGVYMLLLSFFSLSLQVVIMFQT